MHTPGPDDSHTRQGPPDPWRPPARPGPVPPPTTGYAPYPPTPPYYAPARAPMPPPPPKPPREPLSSSGRIRVALAWGWIVIFTILAIVVQVEQGKLVPSDPIVTARPDTQFTMQGKLTLFIDRLNQNNNSRAAQTQIDDAVVQFENLALSSHDLVRIVVIRGEVYGSDEALFMIDELRIPGVYTVDPTTDDFADLDLLEKVYMDRQLSEAEEERLKERHLWFGELATTYQDAPAAAAYRQPRKAGTWLVIGLSVLGIVVALMGLAGVVLMIMALVMFCSGSIVRRYQAGAKPTEAPLLLESIAIFLAIFVLVGVMTLALFDFSEAIVGVAGLALIALCALIPLLYRVRWQRYRELVGLHRGEGLFKEIACGAMGYLAGTPLIFVGFMISFGLFFVSMLIWPPDPDIPIYDPLAGLGPGGLVALVFMLVVWAPVVEEIIFRGYFFAHCRRWMHWSVSGIVVGIVFAAIHPQGVWFIPGLASVGFVLAAIREWRGSLVGSMTAHAIHNGTVAILIAIITLV